MNPESENSIASDSGFTALDRTSTFKDRANQGGGIMAKKKKRRRKRHSNRQKSEKTRNANDRHHILWQRNKWSQGYVYKLRDHPYCKILIPRETLHRHIHLEMIGIPVPSQDSAKIALDRIGCLAERGLISYDDSFEKRLQVLIVLFEGYEPETTDALIKQLNLVREYIKNPP